MGIVDLLQKEYLAIGAPIVVSRRFNSLINVLRLNISWIFGSNDGAGWTKHSIGTWLHSADFLLTICGSLAGNS